MTRAQISAPCRAAGRARAVRFRLATFAVVGRRRTGEDPSRAAGPGRARARGYGVRASPGSTTSPQTRRLRASCRAAILLALVASSVSGNREHDVPDAPQHKTAGRSCQSFRHELSEFCQIPTTGGSAGYTGACLQMVGWGHATARDERRAVAAPRPCCRPSGRGWAGRTPNTEHRVIVGGSLWRLPTGAPWRNLPERYGNWETVYNRFLR